MNSIRLLVVARSMHVGGTEQYLARTLPMLSAYGIEVDVFLLERAGPLLARLEATGISVYGEALPDRTLWGRAVATGRAIRAIDRLVRIRRHHVVHSYLFWSDVVGVLGGRLGRADRTIESRRAMRRWRRPEGLPYFLFETVTNALAHELIANSHAVLRDVENTELALPRVRTVIYNGVDIRRPASATPGQRNKIRLLCVGALAPRKGQELLISALGLARKSGADVAVDLVGSGVDEYLLRSATRRLGLEAEVVFHGEQLQLDRYYDAADIFVLPSRQEGFSNALLEAMASGLPVIATDVGGNREAVPDTGGMIVEPGNAEALASAITRLAGSPAHLADMGRENRAAVEARFSLDSSVRNLADWYWQRRPI